VIVEQRDYHVYTGKLPELVGLYESEGIALQQEILGGLVGAFTTDVGALSTYTTLWRYDSYAEREDKRARLQADSRWQDFLRRVSESAMRELVGRSTAEQVRTERRAEVEEGVRALVQGTLDAYDSGISIVGVQLERADPPTEVADAFEEVQRAQQDLDRFQREAEQYANRRLGDARGEAAQISEQAIGYRQQVVAEAEGESQRFVSVLGEYELAEGVTRERLFLETMERVLRDSNKIILEQGGGPGVLPYLPLDQLQRGQPAAPPRTPSQATGTPNPAPALQPQEATQ
jgi:membrane protease subunit HflK